jgi:hypothetical protein
MRRRRRAVRLQELAGYADMSNPRSASNAWTKIRFKLKHCGDGAAPATPKKPTAGRKMADPKPKSGYITVAPKLRK